MYVPEEDSPNTYKCMASYLFECEEEWGNEDFNFPIELSEYNEHAFEEKYADFKCKECSVKNNVFNAKNTCKLNFKFKPDSDITIIKINLYNVVEERAEDEIKNSVKYFVKNKNLDIDIIFNKKGKYKISINYFDKSLFDGKKENIEKCNKDINYYAIVESDAKENKKFSDEEVLITQPFEDSLKFVNFKYISHKKQNISSEDVQNFEFEFEKK